MGYLAVICCWKNNIFVTWPAQIHIPGLCNVMLQVEGVFFFFCSLPPIDLNHSNPQNTKELFSNWEGICHIFLGNSATSHFALVIQQMHDSCRWDILREDRSKERIDASSKHFWTSRYHLVSKSAHRQKKIGRLVNVNPVTDGMCCRNATWRFATVMEPFICSFICCDASCVSSFGTRQICACEAFQHSYCLQEK